jgi:hypothetical protein
MRARPSFTLLFSSAVVRRNFAASRVSLRRCRSVMSSPRFLHHSFELTQPETIKQSLAPYAVPCVFIRLQETPNTVACSLKRGACDGKQSCRLPEPLLSAHSRTARDMQIQGTKACRRPACVNSAYANTGLCTWLKSQVKGPVTVCSD